MPSLNSSYTLESFVDPFGDFSRLSINRETGAIEYWWRSKVFNTWTHADFIDSSDLVDYVLPVFGA